VLKKPQRRRLRPDLGCSAIGWMDGTSFINVAAKAELLLEIYR
jgi:hypothetical protein